MIEANVGDDGKYGRDHVGTVESAAEANLDDAPVGLLPGEVVESHGDGDFEEARFNLQVALS